MVLTFMGACYIMVYANYWIEEGLKCAEHTSRRKDSVQKSMASAKEWEPPTAEKYWREDVQREENNFLCNLRNVRAATTCRPFLSLLVFLFKHLLTEKAAEKSGQYEKNCCFKRKQNIQKSVRRKKQSYAGICFVL